MPTASVRAFARMLEVQHARVSELIRQGMPAGPPVRGSAGRQIPLRAALDWLIQREVAKHRAGDGGESLAAAELRKLRADADLQELRVVERANAVVDRQDAADVADRVLAVCSAHLDRLPGMVAEQVATASDPAAVRDRIFAATRQVRQAIAADLDPATCISSTASPAPSA